MKLQDKQSKVVSAAQAVSGIADGATIAVNSSSGLCCPDAVLKAIGERFDRTGSPAAITSIHPIAAGDMFGTPGVDHIAKEGLLAAIIAGSYPSGPSSSEPPAIWQMIAADQIKAWNLPSGIIFDMLREGAGKRPGVLTKVGIDTYVDSEQEGGAMTATARAEAIVSRREFNGENWLFFPSLVPDVAIIRATSADPRGNLAFEHEGAYLGAVEMALAARNNGGVVIAQVKRIVAPGSLPPQRVIVPGILVDYVIEAPDQLQTTAVDYDPAISGEISLPLESFEHMDFGVGKTIARRVAQSLSKDWVVNVGFGISANVPRIVLEEGLHGAVTWVIEQGAVGGMPLLDFAFGCSSNAEAFVHAPHQFSYFQAGSFDASLLSFLQIDQQGNVNVSKLGIKPHVTAGVGGFIDITARAKHIIFSGYFSAGAKMSVENGKLAIASEGKVAKLVPRVEQITFSGQAALEKGQRVTYVTERCVLELTAKGLMVTEIAPGIDLQKQILDMAEIPLIISPELKSMNPAIWQDQPFNLTLR